VRLRKTLEQQWAAQGSRKRRPWLKKVVAAHGRGGRHGVAAMGGDCKKERGRLLEIRLVIP